MIDRPRIILNFLTTRWSRKAKFRKKKQFYGRVVKNFAIFAGVKKYSYEKAENLIAFSGGKNDYRLGGVRPAEDHKLFVKTVFGLEHSLWAYRRVSFQGLE